MQRILYGSLLKRKIEPIIKHISHKKETVNKLFTVSFFIFSNNSVKEVILHDEDSTDLFKSYLAKSIIFTP